MNLTFRDEVNCEHAKDPFMLMADAEVRKRFVAPFVIPLAHELAHLRTSRTGLSAMLPSLVNIEARGCTALRDCTLLSNGQEGIE